MVIEEHMVQNTKVSMIEDLKWSIRIILKQTVKNTWNKDRLEASILLILQHHQLI